MGKDFYIKSERNKRLIPVILDFHAHIVEPDHWPPWSLWPGEEFIAQSAEQYIEKMDNCNPKIDKAVVFADAELITHENIKKNNDYVLKAVETYPHRFIGAVLIDGSWGDKAIQEIHRLFDAGFRIVKMRFSSCCCRANSKMGKKIFTEIEKLGALPIVHTDWSHHSNPMVVGDLAMMFPDMKMVLQHFGEYLSRDAFSVAKKADNIYLETSVNAYPKITAKFVKEVSPDRVLFGSDSSYKIFKVQELQDALNRVLCLDLSPEYEKKVLGDNAVELLRFVGVKI